MSIVCRVGVSLLLHSFNFFCYKFSIIHTNGYHNRATLIGIVSDLKSDTTIKNLLAAGVSHVSSGSQPMWRMLTHQWFDISVAVGFDGRGLPHQEIRVRATDGGKHGGRIKGKTAVSQLIMYMICVWGGGLEWSGWREEGREES